MRHAHKKKPTNQNKMGKKKKEKKKSPARKAFRFPPLFASVELFSGACFPAL